MNWRELKLGDIADMAAKSFLSVSIKALKKQEKKEAGRCTKKAGRERSRGAIWLG